MLIYRRFCWTFVMILFKIDLFLGEIMEENKVFVPQPPKELRQSQVQESEIVPELTKVENKVKKPRSKIKLNWNLILNWFGLSISVAAMIVFVYLLSR